MWILWNFTEVGISLLTKTTFNASIRPKPREFLLGITCALSWSKSQLSLITTKSSIKMRRTNVSTTLPCIGDTVKSPEQPTQMTLPLAEKQLLKQWRRLLLWRHHLKILRLHLSQQRVSQPKCIQLTWMQIPLLTSLIASLGCPCWRPCRWNRESLFVSYSRHTKC